MKILGRRRTVTVIMGESEDQTILDVTALESFGLETDPVKGTLKETELLPPITFLHLSLIEASAR